MAKYYTGEGHKYVAVMKVTQVQKSGRVQTRHISHHHYMYLGIPSASSFKLP